MDRCPVEISWIIYRLACMDDGRTGRSLAAVSRQVRRASEPIRYHSIALFGVDQIRSLAGILEQRAQQSKVPPGIYHLFLEDSELHFSDDLQLVFEWILRLSAPTLHTLSIHCHYYNIASLSTPLSHLTTLSVSGVPNERIPQPFPALRRLHVEEHSRMHPGAACTPFLPAFAGTDTLSHIRLSGVRDDVDLARGVGAQLRITVPFDNGAGGVPNAYLDRFREPLSDEDVRKLKEALPALAYVCVEPGMTARTAFGQWVLEPFQKMAALQTADTGRLVLLPHSREYEGERALREWLDFLDGGDGMWPESAPR